MRWGEVWADGSATSVPCSPAATTNGTPTGTPTRSERMLYQLKCKPTRRAGRAAAIRPCEGLRATRSTRRPAELSHEGGSIHEGHQNRRMARISRGARRPGAARGQQPGAKETSYLPVVVKDSPRTIQERMEAAKPEIMKRQMDLLAERYDLGDRPAAGVTMSRGKPVQEGVRVKLPAGHDLGRARRR